LCRHKEDKTPSVICKNSKPSVDKAISLVKLPTAMTICTTVAKPYLRDGDNCCMGAVFDGLRKNTTSRRGLLGLSDKNQ